MDSEKGKEYLSSYKLLGTKINRLKEMIVLNPENADAYKENILNCRKKRNKLENEIDSVDGGILSEILALKYICGKTLEEISLIIGYCKRQTERLHLKAIDKLCCQ